MPSELLNISNANRNKKRQQQSLNSLFMHLTVWVTLLLYTPFKASLPKLLVSWITRLQWLLPTGKQVTLSALQTDSLVDYFSRYWQMNTKHNTVASGYCFQVIDGTLQIEKLLFNKCNLKRTGATSPWCYKARQHVNVTARKQRSRQNILIYSKLVDSWDDPSSKMGWIENLAWHFAALVWKTTHY